MFIVLLRLQHLLFVCSNTITVVFSILKPCFWLYFVHELYIKIDGSVLKIDGSVLKPFVLGSSLLLILYVGMPCYHALSSPAPPQAKVDGYCWGDCRCEQGRLGYARLHWHIYSWPVRWLQVANMQWSMSTCGCPTSVQDGSVHDSDGYRRAAS